MSSLRAGTVSVLFTGRVYSIPRRVNKMKWCSKDIEGGRKGGGEEEGGERNRGERRKF